MLLIVQARRGTAAEPVVGRAGVHHAEPHPARRRLRLPRHPFPGRGHALVARPPRRHRPRRHRRPPRLERKGTRKGTKKRSRRLALNRRWRKPNRGCQDGARTEADPRELSRRTSPSDHSGTTSRMGSHASDGARVSPGRTLFSSRNRGYRPC